MSKKNSSVILKEGFKNYKELYYIYSSFKEQLRLFKKNSFLIAVSGGPDSLALTALAKAYSYEKKCKIYYVLVDHNIRKNSSSEAQSVKKLLKKYKINLSILKNKKAISKNIQGEARKIRYDLLTDFSKKKGVKTILTAHNLEDQVETFFIRLSRGSGLQGLSSMKQSNKINANIFLVRPLLDFKKIQLVKISKMIFGKYYKDPTNHDTKYLRTRIRNLKESLEKSGINYDQIVKSIKNLASSRDTLEAYFETIYKETVNKKKNKILINFNKFNSLNDEMKIKVLKQSIKDLSNAYYLTRSKKIVNLVEQICTSKNVNRTLGGCIVYREKECLILKKEKEN